MQNRRSSSAFFIDMRNVKGPTLDLYNASLEGDLVKMTDLILNMKADPRGHIAPDGWTPLQAAACKGHTQAVDLLLKHGADVNSPNNEGSTALHHALHNGYHQTANLLLAHGASLTVKNDYDQTPYGCIEDSDLQVKLNSYRR